MNLRKFPVISDAGNTYEVAVFRESTFGWIGVDIYEQKRGIFGTRMRIIAGSSKSWSYYTEDKWDYDYVKMAKHEVGKYETSIVDKLRTERQKAQGIEAFAKWDGK